MPRFNAKRWGPSQDSSARHIQRAIKEKAIVLDVAIDASPIASGVRYGCPCGCAGWPKGKGRFAMGHDARYRGILIRAHLTETPVRRVLVESDRTEHDTVPEDAMELAKLEGPSFTSALEAAELRREGKNREVLRKAIGSKRLIQVGRWEYTGQVVAVYGEPGDEQYDIEYVTKTGDIKRAKVDAADAKEVTE